MYLFNIDKYFLLYFFSLQGLPDFLRLFSGKTLAVFSLPAINVIMHQFSKKYGEETAPV
jgi:hypothetical protein